MDCVVLVGCGRFVWCIGKGCYVVVSFVYEMLCVKDGSVVWGGVV